MKIIYIYMTASLVAIFLIETKYLWYHSFQHRKCLGFIFQMNFPAKKSHWMAFFSPFVMLDCKTQFQWTVSFEVFPPVELLYTFLQESCRSGSYQTLSARVLQLSYFPDKPVRFCQIRHFVQIRTFRTRFLQDHTFFARFLDGSFKTMSENWMKFWMEMSGMSRLYFNFKARICSKCM